MTRLLNIFLFCALITSMPSYAASKRVLVYSLDQQYWDVKPGESLSMIAAQLLPSMPEQQQSLMQSIVSLNPSAFINRDPNRLRANIRLWLPGNGLQTHDVSPDPNAGQETQYSWGTIKKRANN